MNGRLDPPPVQPPPPPRPPVPTDRRFPVVPLLAALIVVVAGIAAWWFLVRRGGGAVEVPEALGPPVPVAALESLLEEAEGGDLDSLGLRLTVGKEGDRPTYRVGDELRVGFAVSRDARCALFHRDARGAFQVLYPSGQKESVAVDPDDRIVLPMKVSEPVGDEAFLLACLSGDDGTTLAGVLEGDREEWPRAVSAQRQDIEVRGN